MKILVVNGGSSTYKLCLYDLEKEELREPLWTAVIDWGRKDNSLHLGASELNGGSMEKNVESLNVQEGFQLLLNTLWEGETQVIDGPQAIESIGHRVVHGGRFFERPIRINSAVKEKIRQLIPLAPLHNPVNLRAIEWMETLFPLASQFAVFDTAFHVTMPEMIKTYPVPFEWREKGIQRYGFHGISHHYCAERAAIFLKKDQKNFKMINCHLGNGCSLCAIQEGKSYETTMGLTPMEGLMMGTRCGSIDPGLLLYLMREHGVSWKDLDDDLNFSSGLKGISGCSDMRDLLDQPKNERNRLAIEMFIHRLKTFIGAMTVSLGGVDVLSFTGGIGENASWIREETCRGLACLGVVIDNEKNRFCLPDVDVSIESGAVRVLVLRTHEEWMIARACLKTHLK
ncbi:MAG: acetate/propionate family kinase [Parachlamydiaceae bacterium]